MKLLKTKYHVLCDCGCTFTDDNEVATCPFCEKSGNLFPKENNFRKKYDNFIDVPAELKTAIDNFRKKYDGFINPDTGRCFVKNKIDKAKRGKLFTRDRSIWDR